MPIKMKSLKSHRYGTRMLTAGEEYEVPGVSHARLMTALGNATRLPVEAPLVPTPAPAPVAAPARAAKTTRSRWSRAAAEQTEQNPAEPATPTVPVDHAGLVGTVDEPKADEA